MSGGTDFVQAQIEQAGASSFASQSAEESVVCALVSSPEDAAQFAAELKESDFAFPALGKILRAVQTALASGRKIDLVTVDAALGEMYSSEHAQLTNALLACVNSPSAAIANTEDHVRIVRELAARRRSIQSFESLLKRLKDPTQNVADILDQMRVEAGQIVESRPCWENMTDVLLATYEYLERRQRGEIKAITTGIPNVDALVGGFFGGELTIIGARPSVGKSAFGANIALEAARKGFKVAVVSREMTDIQYGQRILSHDSWVDGMALRKGEIDDEAWSRLAESLGPLSSLPIQFAFSVRTVEALRMEVQRKAERGEIDMLIIDYLQLMHTQKRFREEHLRVGYISKALKDIAIDFNLPVIALAQVNRETDGQMPTLKSLKASGDIEQDADGVIFLHRPAAANDPYVDPRDQPYFDAYEQKGLTYLCIGVAKQRQGAVGKACVLFDPAHMRYIAIDRNH